MKKLLILSVPTISAIFGFVLGFSLSVNAGTTQTQCKIDPVRDVVFCSNNKDSWRCVSVAAGEWSCEGKLTAWTTDCPTCGNTNG